MIKSVEQYLESLNDGRQVWCLGEKVSDVRTHPTLSSIIKTACMDYVLPNHPDFRELLARPDLDGRAEIEGPAARLAERHLRRLAAPQHRLERREPLH